MSKLEILNEIKSLMDSILSQMDSDKQLQSRCTSWGANLSQTLQHLESTDLEGLIEIYNSISKLSSFLNQWNHYMKEKRILRIRDYLYSTAQELLGTWFNGRDIPVILANMDPFQAYLVPVPFKSKIDHIVACNKESSLSGYAGIAHEIGHILLHRYIEIKTPETYQRSIFTPIEEVGLSLKIDQRLIRMVQETWACSWFQELYADAFAVTCWGPGVVMHWMKRPEPSLNNLIPGMSDMILMQGDAKYPPENLRTVWMIARLTRHAKTTTKETMRILEKNRPSTKFALHPKFLNRYSLTDKDQKQLKELFYHKTIAGPMNEVIDKILQWGGVELVPVLTVEGVKDLRTGRKPSGTLREVYSSLLEFDSINHFQGNALGKYDGIILD